MGGGASSRAGAGGKACSKLQPMALSDASSKTTEDWRFAPALVTPTSQPPSWCGGEDLRGVEGRLTEVEIQEVLEVFEIARIMMLRGLQRASLRRLAERGRIEEFPPNTFPCGPGIWTSGWCLVLSGHASVLFKVGGMDQEVAALHRGDSFGWDGTGEDDDAFEAWHRLGARVAVARGQALRVLRVVWDEPFSLSSHLLDGLPCPIPSAGRTPSRRRSVRKSTISKGRASSKTFDTPKLADESLDLGVVSQKNLGGLSDLLACLWLSSSAPPGGIAYLSGGLMHAHFLAGLWAPLLAELEQHQGEIRNRKAKGYRIHDCFPLQGRQIVELRDQVFHLTELWYGSTRGGNLSTIYRWFMEAMHQLGVTAYSFDSIPQEHSADGWAVAIDGQARAAALKEKGTSDASYVAAGGARQRQGRSAIDNTVLRNVFMPHEARELLVGRRLRKSICKFLVMRQICLLRRLSVQLEMDLLHMAAEAGSFGDHTAVRAVLQSLPAAALRSAGVNPDGLSMRLLRDRGCVLAGFGQLSSEDQKAVQEETKRLLAIGSFRPAQADAEDVFERLVAWCRDRPGEFFEGEKRRHVEVKVAGLLAGKVIIIKRSCMERFSLARYFPLAWKRTQPLYGVTASGPIPVRPAEMSEASHVRVNECPYAPLHGMSLSGGGYATDPRMKKGRGGLGYSLLTELQWVRDPSANVENWFLTDIEKILQESWQLNPHGSKELMLPGETFVNVGQNPKVGSSIRETQHTQLCQGSVSSYPVLQITTAPRFSERLGASLDLVEMGLPETPAEQRGLMVKLDLERPVRAEVLEFLVSLRLRIMEQLGGGDSIDFLVLSTANERGGFTVIFAPIAQLLKIGDNKPDFADWANPMTGESSESCGLEEARVDFGKGVGAFLVAKPALREQILAGGEEFLRRIWAFNRVPGAREVIEGFLQERHIFSVES